MNKATTYQTIRERSLRVSLTKEDRAAILKRTRGAWKGRSLKADLRTLAKIRRGWDRKIG